MPDGAVAELIRPPIAAENPPIEPHIQAPEMQIPQESHTPLAIPDVDTGVDMDKMRQEVQNMIAQADNKPLESTHSPVHEPEVKRKGKFMDFLKRHKLLALMLAPLVFIFTSLFGAFKGDGGGSH